MNQKPKSNNSPFRKLFKKAEHVVEKALDHFDSEFDHDKKKHHHHHHHYKKHHENKKQNITINVNIDDCCSSDIKVLDTGSIEERTQPLDRSTHETDITNDSIDGDLDASEDI